MKYPYILSLILIAVTCTLVGDIFFKRSNGFGNPRYLVLGALFYFLGASPIPVIFRHVEFGLVFIIWEAITVILAVVVGHVVFGESVTVGRSAALILAIAAIVLSHK